MPRLPTSAVLLLGSLARTALRSAEATVRVEMLDASTWADAARTWQPGLREAEVSVVALDDLGAGNFPTQPLSLCPEGDATQGLPALLLGTYTAEEVRRVSGPGELVERTWRFASDDRPGLGYVLLPRAARTTSGNGTSKDDTASSSNGATAILHCTAASGTSPTLAVKVQHSADNSTWADLITFTTLTAAGAERKVVSGTVNRYVRAIWTIGGTSPSFTFAVTFAR